MELRLRPRKVFPRGILTLRSMLLYARASPSNMGAKHFREPYQAPCETKRSHITA
jgi:hypothetical protein